MHTIAEAAEASGLSLTVKHGGPGESSLMTDPDKLREVVNNLLHNAVQYNRPQGRIEVHVHRENGHVDVAVTHGGQAERAVLAGILVVADTNERGLEEPYNSREHLRAWGRKGLVDESTS